MPRCTRCCRPSQQVRAELLRDLLAVLVGDLVLTALDVGLEVALIVPVDVGGVIGVVAVGVHFGIIVVAVGAQRHIAVILLAALGATVDQGGLTVLREACGAVLLHLNHRCDVHLEEGRHVHDALAVVSQSPHLQVVEALVGRSEPVADKAFGLDLAVLGGHCEVGIVVHVLMFLGESWRKVP